MCMEKTPWEKALEFHGHFCPGLAMGYRVAQEALGRMEINPSVDEELVAIVENDGCGVDAIQVLTSCTFGKGNLIFKDYGKNVYSFGARGRDRGLRFSLKNGAMDQVVPPAWKALREKVFKKEATEEEKQEYRELHAGYGQRILEMPLEDLFEVQEVPLDLPPKARIFNSVECAFCRESVMEPRARVREGKFACPDCYAGYPGRVAKT